jgi:protein-L-isoaspartate(D-aspartate) O-methyltransferase
MALAETASTFAEAVLGERQLDDAETDGERLLLLDGMLADSVFTIEIVSELAASAAERLEQQGHRDVQVRDADGYYGWEEHAPFDAIFVTAAAGHIPPPLVEQLVPGGRMAIPVGGPFQVQNLVLVEKAPDGSITTRSVLPVQFVPLTGGH